MCVEIYIYNLCKVWLQKNPSLQYPSSAEYLKHRTKEFLINSKLDTGLSTLLNRDICSPQHKTTKRNFPFVLWNDPETRGKAIASRSPTTSVCIQTLWQFPWNLVQFSFLILNSYRSHSAFNYSIAIVFLNYLNNCSPKRYSQTSGYTSEKQEKKGILNFEFSTKYKCHQNLVQN